MKQGLFVENLKKLLPYVRPYRGKILLFFLAVFPLGFSDAVMTWALKPLMDRILLLNGEEITLLKSTLIIIPGVVLLFALGQGVLRFFADYLSAWVGNKIANDLKLQLFRKLLNLDPLYFDQHNSGEVIVRYYSDAEIACKDLLAQMKNFISRAVTLLSLAGLLFGLAWKLAIIAIVVVCCTVIPVTKLRRRLNQLIKQMIGISSKLITIYNETFNGIRTICAYNLQQFQLARVSQRLKEFFQIQIKMAQKIAWLSPSMHVIAALGIGVTIGFGAYLVVSQQISVGALVSFITALVLCLHPLKEIGGSVTQLQQTILAVERVFDVLALQPTIQVIGNGRLLNEPIQSVEFQAVNFEYAPHKPVLNQLSFNIYAGQTVALVGPSGGGKTTITSLLLRLYDVTKGSILINGHDLREYDLTSLRSQVAVVFQNNFLFAGSIRENLLMGNMDAEEKQLWLALDRAYLRDFVEKLPQGLDSTIGEGGVLLSGGQKQRLAIARAFLKDAPMVILDEATSALDNQAEAVIQLAIQNLTNCAKTVLIIAHRLSTICSADRILVIQEGRVVEDGDHQTLIAKEGGVYHKLYQVQFEQ